MLFVCAPWTRFGVGVFGDGDVRDARFGSDAAERVAVFLVFELRAGWWCFGHFGDGFASLFLFGGECDEFAVDAVDYFLQFVCDFGVVWWICWDFVVWNGDVVALVCVCNVETVLA